MPNVRWSSHHHDLCSTGTEAPISPSSRPDLNLPDSVQAFRARKIPTRNNRSSLMSHESYEKAVNPGSRKREAVRSLPTPDSSPERFLRTANASKQQADRSPPIILTPPSSDDEDGIPLEIEVSDSDHSLEFPIHRRPLPSTHYSTTSIPQKSSQTPGRRVVSAGNRRLMTKPSTDRFITTRPFSDDLPCAFRSSKAAQDLTRTEKLLRDTSTSPDPFGPLIPSRLREQRASNFRGRGELSQNSRIRSRTIGTLNTIALPQAVSAPQNRQVSAGAVWNVGGSAQIGQVGPVRAIPNGRGGFLSSGSNAVMYTAEFLDQRSPSQEAETLENRVARALDIDRTKRLIHTNRVPEAPRSASTGSIGLSKRDTQAGLRTKWINGEWVQSSSSRTCYHLGRCSGLEVV